MLWKRSQPQAIRWDRSIQNMLSNPVVAPFLEERFDDVAAEIDLETILSELEAFGDVTLKSTPLHSCQDPERRHVCVVDDARSWSQTSLSGSGNSPLLAALRCLMEALSESTRQGRRGADEFSVFLSRQQQ